MAKRKTKTLTHEECQKKLAEAVDNEITAQLNDFQREVCGPRRLLTDGIQKDIAELKADVQGIHHKLDNVSANGNKSLDASLKDLYALANATKSEVMDLKSKIETLIDTNREALARAKVAKAVKEWWGLTVISKLGKSSVGRAITAVMILILINTAARYLGITFDLQDIVAFLLKFVGM